MRKKNRIRRAVALVLIWSLAVMCLAGCGSSGSSGKSSGSKSKEVNVLIWDGSYPDDIFDEFEKKTGIHVNVSYITNTDEILAKMIAANGSSDYDFIDLESAYVKPFVDNDLLEKLNFDNIPNDADTEDKYKEVPGDENKEFTCSNATMGYTFIVYNKKTCPIEIKSFKDLADPALKDQIVSVVSTISLFGEALNALGYKPDSQKESEYKEAADLWSDIKKNVKLFSGASCYQAMLDGEASVGFMFDYAQLEANAENPEDYEVAKIPEGYERYNSAWAVPKGAKNQENAEKLMNFLLEPESIKEREEFYPSWCGNEKGWDLVDDKIKKNPAFSLDDSILDNTWMIPVSDTAIDYMDKYLTKFMSDTDAK